MERYVITCEERKSVPPLTESLQGYDLVMLFFILRLVPKLGQSVLAEGSSAPLITRPYQHRNPISNRHTATAVSSDAEQDEVRRDAHAAS